MAVNLVSCLGSGDGKPGELAYDAMMEVGRLLAKAGVTILTGGFGGAGMEAAPRGAKEVDDGKSFGYTLLGKPGNPFLTKTVDCHNLAKNVPVTFAEFGVRLCALMGAEGFIIAAGGGAGTMVEFLTAIQFNRKVYGKAIPGEKRRIALLNPFIAGHPQNFSFKMLDLWEESGFLGDPGEHIRDLIHIVDTAQEAVSWILTGWKSEMKGKFEDEVI